VTSANMEQLIELALRRNSSMQGTRVFDIEANINATAKNVLTAAVGKVGRVQAVEFNRNQVTFNLTSGKASYKLKAEILSKHPILRNMEYMWITDEPGSHIQVLSYDDFSGWARGSSESGKPTKATLHSNDPLILEVWPSPDDAYEVVAHAKENITDLQNIPAEYHDVVLAEAYKLVHAAANPGAAISLAAEGKFDMEGDAATGSAPSIAMSARELGQSGGISRADHYNTTGE